MYRISKDIDLSKLIGAFTTQICIGAYDLQFDFGTVHFQVESAVEIVKEGVVVDAWQGGSWPKELFQEILNVPVKSVSMPDDKRIILKFENDLEMHLMDDSDQFECMKITVEGEVWII